MDREVANIVAESGRKRADFPHKSGFRPDRQGFCRIVVFRVTFERAFRKAGRFVKTRKTKLTPQPLQHVGGGKTVRRRPDRGLEAAQRLPGLAAELAVRRALVEAALGQKLLQFQPFGARQHPFLPRPGLHERRPAAQAVGEMADRQRIGLRRVVFHDHPEILQHQEAGPLRAGRRQQIGLLGRIRERLAVGPLHSLALPLRDRHRLGLVRQHEIEALRQHHLVAPAPAGLPAVLLEVVGGRRNQVGGDCRRRRGGRRRRRRRRSA